jgi:hypothetical protein
MKMQVRFAVALLAGLISLPASSLAAKESEPDAAATPATWHVTGYVTGLGAVRSIRYWSKGPWMRAETVIKGHPIVTIVRDGDYVAYDRVTGMGARIGRSPGAVEQDAKRLRPFGNDFEELVAQGGELVEAEADGNPGVEIWRITDSAGRRKLWVSSDETRLPARLETFVRGSFGSVTLNYSDWMRGLELPDRFFEAPAEIQLERLDYSAYIDAAASRPVAPVLYPDLLHGDGG